MNSQPCSRPAVRVSNESATVSTRDGDLVGSAVESSDHEVFISGERSGPGRGANFRGQRSSEHGVFIAGERVVFTVTGAGTAVTVSTDCDVPSLVLLARKGNPEYWNGDIWFNHTKDRRVWSADIVHRMLEEGHVATGTLGDGGTGPQVAVDAAGGLRDTRLVLARAACFDWCCRSCPWPAVDPINGTYRTLGHGVQRISTTG